MKDKNNTFVFLLGQKLHKTQMFTQPSKVVWIGRNGFCNVTVDTDSGHVKGLTVRLRVQLQENDCRHVYKIMTKSLQ